MRILLVGALVACLSVGGLATYALWSRAHTEVVSISHAGVCVDAPSPGYAIEASNGVINVHADSGEDMQIVIGQGAQLNEAELEAALNTSGVLVAAANLPNDYVAEKSGLTFRAVLSGVDGIQRERLLAGVHFCDNS